MVLKFEWFFLPRENVLWNVRLYMKWFWILFMRPPKLPHGIIIYSVGWYVPLFRLLIILNDFRACGLWIFDFSNNWSGFFFSRFCYHLQLAKDQSLTFFMVSKYKWVCEIMTLINSILHVHCVWWCSLEKTENMLKNWTFMESRYCFCQQNWNIFWFDNLKIWNESREISSIQRFKTW